MCAISDVNIVMMMFFELFLLRKISEFPSGIRTHNLLIAGETQMAERRLYFDVGHFHC